MIVDASNMGQIWGADRTLVFADGNEVDYVINIDTETNEIEYSSLDEKGKFTVCGDSFLTAILTPKIMTIIAYKDDKIIKVYTYGAD